MIRLNGPWAKGFAFDLHTISSEYTGDNEYGHPTFDTTRSQIGQLLYELKYGQHEEVLSHILNSPHFYSIRLRLLSGCS